MNKIVLASSNQGKIKEFRQLFSSINIEIIPQSEFNIPDIEETGLSFVENAIIKARHASELSKLPAIADDSGLVVNSLNGAPGIYSARFSADRTDTANNLLLLDKMKLFTGNERNAYFNCVLVFMKHKKDPSPIISEGILNGKLLEFMRGQNGFGYDPLFWLEEHQCTVAELSSEEKNLISHRSIALNNLSKKLNFI